MTASNAIRYYPLGDSALVVHFADEISENTHALIRKVIFRLDASEHSHIIEYVPAFTTITIYYDPLTTTYDMLVHLVHRILKNLPEDEEKTATIKEIPVWYNGADMDYILSYTGLSRKDIIRIHSEQTYLVHMIGFAPGFPYLGGMDKRLATPRKEIPRTKVEAGAVGIAGAQTGIYPMETPGGWQIVGQTPLLLFDVRRDSPSLLESGDRVRFVPIHADEFTKMKGNGNGN